MHIIKLHDIKISENIWSSYDTHLCYLSTNLFVHDPFEIDASKPMLLVAAQ